MNDETNYLSKEKFDELTQELEHLKTVRRRGGSQSSLNTLVRSATFQKTPNTKKPAICRPRPKTAFAMLRSI